jgi:hypothetical protein
MSRGSAEEKGSGAHDPEGPAGKEEVLSVTHVDSPLVLEGAPTPALMENPSSAVAHPIA